MNSTINLINLITINYLGKERYKLRFAITSIFAITCYADLGLGIGLIVIHLKI